MNTYILVLGDVREQMNQGHGHGDGQARQNSHGVGLGLWSESAEAQTGGQRRGSDRPVTERSQSAN